MKVLFVMRSTVYVRNFESVLRLLAARGHEVVVVADRHGLVESNEIIERLCREHPSIHHVLPPWIRFTPWVFLGLELRRAVDYLRYLAPAYVGAAKLRQRAERGAPPFAVDAAQRLRLGGAWGRAAFARILRWCDRAIPRTPEVDAFIAEHDPDLVLVTPLVEPGSPQALFLRSARAHGSRTGLCVYSWDNLTNKGLIQDPLDVVSVWNEAMKREAVTLHRLPASRVVVTGAAAYDHWFGWRPHEARDAFCARVGLDPARPYLLYLCSSKFIAPREVAYVRDWVARLRATSPVLRDVGVLVRPHPQNTLEWVEADLGDLANVSVWPRGGANPVDARARAAYYDSIHHSAAVVGVNTSAQIESAIVGRDVYTLLADEFRDTQEGTLHFRHLREAGGGLLHVAATFEEHVSHLETALRARPDEARRQRFLEAFVRPHGLDAAATPPLVEALERTAAPGRRVRGGVWWGPFLRPLLARIAARMSGTDRARTEKAGRRERFARQRALAAEARRRHKRALEAARVERSEAERAAHAAAAAGEAAVAERAFRHYRAVRDVVQRMCDAGGRPGRLSGEEERLLASLREWWHATPERVAALRRHCGPISELSPAPPGTGEDATPRGDLRREHFLLRRQMPDDLIVVEPDVLGSVAYVKRDERFNEESVRYFKALAARQDGGVLGAFRDASERRLVWEIGGGWGGFAYQFTAACPRTTYVISAIPDLFLLSAVYLQTVRPEARVRLFDPSAPPDALWRGWEEIDFLFVPEGATASLDFPRLDLVVDLASMRAMTAERIDAHVERAFACGARFFYSLVPGAEAAREMPGVWRAVEARYWPQPVPPRVLKVPPVVDLDGAPALESDVAHLVGWRRLCA
jgi:hypothetical protein